MGYSSDSERPAKRVKISQPFQRLQSVPDSVPSAMPNDTLYHGTWPSSTAPDALPPAAPDFEVWHPSSFELPPAELVHQLPSYNAENAHQVCPSTVPALLDVGHEQSTPPASASPGTQVERIPQTPATLSTEGSVSAYTNIHTVSQDRKFSSGSGSGVLQSLLSPFNDCLDSFGTFTPLAFDRPSDGSVNGYVKFRWANKPPQHPSVSQQASLPNEGLSWGLIPTELNSVPTSILPGISLSCPISSESTLARPQGFMPSPSEWQSSFTSSTTTSPELVPRDARGSMSLESVNPRMLPPQFGLEAKMEQSTDRKFWQFYIHNWCPGRSIMKRTNLWLNDFGRMQSSDGVRAAIQCLAGVYIYDYMPQPKISKRINELFGIAESRLTALLNDQEHLQQHHDELITIAVVLSMQDVVLTERRRKKPYTPRWLDGFLRSEKALERTDPGSRFWKKGNIQLTSMRIAQSIIVGRATILAQPMMRLPSPAEFDPTKEASRFGWLLYGQEKDMYAIHGGCGFSKKLLHVLSQVMYCAARLQQDEENPVTPMTAQMLLDQLQHMRQWNSEAKRGWEPTKSEPQTITWVRNVRDDYLIDNIEEMTDVTAEAWRLASIVYLQCRALRLPRNHHDVVDNLTDLASCIKIMPTSGRCFTAQAPLFPVFLLGLTATDPEHKEASQRWFEEVVETPVRSSVPPLFEVLKGIWAWLDEEIPLSFQAPPEHVGLRDPWWERLVERVQQNEQETPCLT